MADYPEHAKLYPHSRFFLIYEFFEYLTELGVSDLDWNEVHDLVLTWQGVNVAAYHAESAAMRVDYAWLYQQFGIPAEDVPKPKLRVTRVTKSEVGEEVIIRESAEDLLMSRLRQFRE